MGRSDPVDILLDQSASRLPDLVPVNNGRMLSSPSSFYRGSAAIMAADLRHAPTSGIKVQLNGDAHLSNFGGYTSPDRDLAFDLADFDETLPGPWEWDVKRLVASLAVAGRDRGFDTCDITAVVRSTAAAYRRTMHEMAASDQLQVWYSRLTAGDIRERWGRQAGRKALWLLDRQIEKAMATDHARMSRRLTTYVGGQTRIRADLPRITPVSDLLAPEEAGAFADVLAEMLSGYRWSLTGSHRHLVEQFRHVDVARKVVGVGSVGSRSWIVLLLGDADEPLVLQLKEVGKSVLAPYAGRSVFDKQGQRVVVGQQLVQASCDVFLGWTRAAALDGAMRDFHVRQPWDWKLTADVGRHSPATLAIYGQACAWILARAHARSGDRVAISGYLGRSDVFDVAMGEFAGSYADQNERDYARFVQGARDQRFQVALDR